MEYTQDALFYTAEDMVANTTKALNEAYADADLRIQRAKDNLNAHIAESVVTTLKTFVKEGTLFASTAQEIYDALASQHGWSEASLTTNTYDVVVSLDGDYICTVSDIEAEDEDSACDIVRDDFTLYNADVSLTFVDGQGNEYDHTVSGVEHELSDYQDNLDFSADLQ